MKFAKADRDTSLTLVERSYPQSASNRSRLMLRATAERIRTRRSDRKAEWPTLDTNHDCPLLGSVVGFLCLEVTQKYLCGYVVLEVFYI